MNRYKTGYVKGWLYEGAAPPAVLLICRYVDIQISLLKGNAVLVMLLLKATSLSLLDFQKSPSPAGLKLKKKVLRSNKFIYCTPMNGFVIKILTRPIVNITK